MKKNRPVNLDLTTIHQPLPAIASITHRITGVILFVGLAFMFYLFDLSLSDQAGFAATQDLLETSVLAKFITWGLLVALAYHLFVGVKHLVMDFGYGEDLASAQLAVKVMIVATIICAVLAGMWIW